MIKLNRLGKSKINVSETDSYILNELFEDIYSDIKYKMKVVEFYKTLTEEQQSFLRYIKDEARESGYGNGYDAARFDDED